MSGSLIPNGRQQFIDSNGNPLASGKVYYYIPNTTTPKNTYQDAALTILNTNPIQLDANGQCEAWGASGAYRQQVYDVNNNLIWDVESDSPASYSDVQAVQTNLTNFENSLASSTGSNLVGYNYGQTGSVTETVQSKLRQILSVTDFGAVGDGTTDNTSAFTALSNYINSNYVLYTTEPVGIYFPQGIYKYSSGLTFTAPVCLYSDSLATLNYTGTSHAMILGPGIISGFEILTQGEYTVDGLRFTGGANAVHGIYVPDYIIRLRIRNCIFFDYGNGVGGSNYCIFGQANCWDTIIENCGMYTLNSSSATANFIAFPGTDTTGVSDGGNSRVSIINCTMAAYNNINLGVYALLNCVKGRILGGSFVNSSYGVLLGSLANDCVIDGLYAEMASNAISYITVSSTTSSGNLYYPQGAIVKNGYINFHSNNIPMLYPFDASVKVSGWTISDMQIANIVNNQPLITLNDINGQQNNIIARIEQNFVPPNANNGYLPILVPDYSNAENWSTPGSVLAITVEANASYTLQQSDVGSVKNLTSASTVVTIPPTTSYPNIPIGSIIYLHNQTGGNQTIVGGSGVTLSLTGTASTGTRTIGSNGMAKLFCISSNVWLIDGPNVS